MEENVIVAFADTLFKADFTLDKSQDGIIWVHQIEDPSAFGVVKLNEENIITDFIEKPEEFVSDLAIIGIYYFKDGSYTRDQLQYLIDNNIKDKGEYQITNALENMKNQGKKLRVGSVNEWLDYGNKDATVYTNQRILEHLEKNERKGNNISINDSIVIQPCFIGDNVQIFNSVIGPHVSIGKSSIISNSIVKNSIIKEHSKVEELNTTNSIIGAYSQVKGEAKELSLGDYTSMF